MRVSQIHVAYLDQQNRLRRAWLLSIVAMYHRMIEECEQFRKTALAFPLDSPERFGEYGYRR